MAKRLVHKSKNGHTYVYEREEHDKYLGKCPEACPQHGGNPKVYEGGSSHWHRKGNKK